MSYEPSHRKPPRQERWPNATPGEGWPAYQQGDGGRGWESVTAYAGSRNGFGDPWDGHGGARYRDPGSGSWAAGNGHGGTTTAYPAAGDAYVGERYADGFDGAADGYAGGGYAGGGYGGGGYGGGGYGGPADGYGAAEDDQETGNGYDEYEGWDGYAQPGREFAGSAGYLPQEEHPALEPAGSSVLVAPDTMGEWWRQDRDDGLGQDLADRGPLVGAVTGLLAAAVTIGVATFASAFVRPLASPASAVSAALVDRIPATLRSHLTAHVGPHLQAVLLLGVIGLVAMVFGCAARRNASLGVAGIAAFCLLGAFVAISGPESRPSDVVPWAIGGLAGALALLWLVRASAPTPEVESLRPAYGGSRRSAR
jgi:hypothetical protein